MGQEGDIYVRQLTLNHAVIIEKIDDTWHTYRIHWTDNGKIQKIVDLIKTQEFEKALLEAKKYIEWCSNRGNRKIQKRFF